MKKFIAAMAVVPMVALGASSALALPEDRKLEDLRVTPKWGLGSDDQFLALPSLDQPRWEIPEFDLGNDLLLRPGWGGDTGGSVGPMIELEWRIDT